MFYLSKNKNKVAMLTLNLNKYSIKETTMKL